MRTTKITLLLLCVAMVFFPSWPSFAGEIELLSPENWQQLVPRGKEVDAIYGDYVLRNDAIVAVVAAPLPSRNANMTVKGVGGALIDLTRRDRQSDQLSAFYPGAGRDAFRKAEVIDGTLRVTATAAKDKPAVEVSYRLDEKSGGLEITSMFTNPHQQAISVELIDAVRADRDFAMGHDEALDLFWFYDDFWGQAYGVVPAGEHELLPDENSVRSKRPFLRYETGGSVRVTLKPGEKHKLQRYVVPGANLLDVLAAAHRLTGKKLHAVEIAVADKAGPIEKAHVELSIGGKDYGYALTPPDGKLRAELPAGKYQVHVEALGRPTAKIEIDAGAEDNYAVTLDLPGYVAAKITDANGGPIPCKVEFRPREGTPHPSFGPDTAEHGVRNLYYSHDGKFRQEIAPGKYDVIVSHGPEYDAIFTEIEVARGKETRLAGKLIRSVDTKGWVSSDFHSHSSPSGDNTSSQYGRVLNLLCEHIEFAPCTEHNRISSYVPHLKRLGVEHLMATCSGMELTGSPLPLNHQNAFPLLHKPHTQDGGAPQTDANPVVQIERLALWDNASDKLVQENHPNIVQLLGDADLNGKPDAGFEKMFGFMDVIEVHPPGAILDEWKAPATPRDRWNRMLNWLQLHNLGYRLPGVVNTDAHYNFHGSGWLRNYLECPTDDPARIDVMDMVHAAEHGHLIMTNGPFLEVRAEADKAGPKSRGTAGDDVIATSGKATLHVRVQCPNWLDVNRVQVFLNGQADAKLNFTRKETPKRFADGVVKFDEKIPLELTEDTHVVVAAAGEGLQLGAVMGPDAGKAMPVAVSNPIFIDTGGDGFTANGDTLGIPLPILEGHNPSKPHKH